MRVDVALTHRDIDAELARLHERMHTPGDSLHDMPAIPTALPGLVFRYREVSGEFYVYVEDPARRTLAGCTVFNRAFEVERTAERYLRSPHSRYGSGYQRRGLATAVYTWALQAGLCLITGPRQSVGAHGLWRSLAASRELLFVQVRDKKLQCVGGEPPGRAFDDFDTRMVLLGAGWSGERFASIVESSGGGGLWQHHREGAAPADFALEWGRRHHRAHGTQAHARSKSAAASTRLPNLASHGGSLAEAHRESCGAPRLRP